MFSHLANSLCEKCNEQIFIKLFYQPLSNEKSKTYSLYSCYTPMIDDTQALAEEKKGLDIFTRGFSNLLDNEFVEY